MTEALFLKEGFIKANAPLKNGLGRFIPQLMRITIKFCKESPTSAGVRYNNNISKTEMKSHFLLKEKENFFFIFYREFIEKDVVQFAKENPGTAIYLKPRRHRTPVIVAEYCKFCSYILELKRLFKLFKKHF